MPNNYLTRVIIYMFLLAYPFVNFGAYETSPAKVVQILYAGGPSSVLDTAPKKIPDVLDPEGNSTNYLLFRAGLSTWRTTSKMGMIFYNENIKDGSCKTENIYDQNFKVGNNSQAIQEKVRAFRTCLNYKVTDLDGGVLEYPANQENCKISHVSDSVVIISGGDCFFKAKENQKLTIDPFPNPKCSDRHFLIQNKISPMELVTDLRTFIYPSETIGEIFEPISRGWNKNIYLNINPGKELLHTTKMDDREGNVFYRPDIYVYPDIMISSLKLSSKTAEKKMGEINLGFLVNSHGENSNCQSELCTSYFNFDMPFVQKLSLFQLSSNGKRTEVLTDNYLGGRLPSRWAGEFLSSAFSESFEFQKGGKYQIELEFSDPLEDFEGLRNTYKSLFKRLAIGGSLSLIPGPGGTIGSINGIGGMTGFGTLGEMPTLGDDIFAGISGRDGSLLRIFKETFSDPSFPPNYSQVCNREMVCKNASKGPHLKFIINFEVKDLSGTEVILTDSFNVERISSLFPTYKIKVEKKPTIICN